MIDSVGARVRTLRKAKNLTQRLLADRAGLYHTTISELERGVTVPGLPTLEKIARELGVTPADLIQPSNIKKKRSESA